MAISWRRGFRRVLVALAWCYWGLAAVVIISIGKGAMETLDPQTYETIFHRDLLNQGIKAAANAAGWAIAIYAVLFLLVSGLRWIARGFAATEA